MKNPVKLIHSLDFNLNNKIYGIPHIGSGTYNFLTKHILMLILGLVRLSEGLNSSTGKGVWQERAPQGLDIRRRKISPPTLVKI